MSLHGGMVQIAELFVYPVKSCRGIKLAEARVAPRGFLHDREFLVVDEKDSFLTQRNAPELARVELAFEADKVLRLNFAGTGDLRVALENGETQSGTRAPRKVTIFHDEVLADDVGDDAAEWFSAVLGRPCRLMRIGPTYTRQAPAAKIEEQYRFTIRTEISFTDAFPTLLIAEESLADLNRRLSEPRPMNRFRPNIVVRGCEPYSENSWKTVRAGDVLFRCATSCARCVITTIDQDKGQRDGTEPLRTLATYRRTPDGSGVIFGEYLIHSGVGIIREGQELWVES